MIRTRTNRSTVTMLVISSMLAMGGCASTGDVEKVQETNRVQDQRLQALEISTGKEVDRLTQKAQALTVAIKAAEGRLITGNERLEKMIKENSQLTDTLEKANAQFQSLRRRLLKQEEERKRLTTTQEQELDALRLKMDDLEKLMKSPIANLPAKTAADKMFREAFAMMISGQLDLAADKFEAFGKIHRGDPRVLDALYRRGQAFFLMRKYDHAIVPFFELVDKNPKHELAINARWMLARGLEETGDLKLAREFYAQLIAENTIHKADATRRVHFLNRLFPDSTPKGAPEAKVRQPPPPPPPPPPPAAAPVAPPAKKASSLVPPSIGVLPPVAPVLPVVKPVVAKPKGAKKPGSPKVAPPQASGKRAAQTTVSKPPASKKQRPKTQASSKKKTSP